MRSRCRYFFSALSRPYNPQAVPFTPGTRLGVYEIVAQIGEGGMGVVYRARDTKLNRDVALKVLPDLFASDADRLARFTREAQTLASLNHPNIAHIHGLEESGGVRALVMELVEGDDLSQRIARGAVPVDEALPIAKQIAEALEAAHQQGIVHRDLKPANIKLRPDGSVKVLDFGLAKALASEQVPASPTPTSQSPTITSPAMLTGMGIVLGTAAYMAPEQAKGREADKRSDIWAFGCVLYEMLAGRRPFDGEDITDVLGAVVRLEPAWEALPADVPAPVRTLLKQCLVKDRRRRVGDIAAVLFVLEHQAGVAPTVPVASRSNRIAWLVAALSIIALIATAVVALRMSRSGAPPSDPVQFSIAAPEKTVFGGPAAGGTGRAAQLAISPDGRNIVFVAGAQSAFQIWLRPLATGEARPIQGTEGGAFPFWSPDSQFVAFFAGGKLKKVAIAGGPPVELADAATGRGGSWSRDNVIVFDRALGSGLFRVSSGGGVPTPVTTLADGEDAHRWPHFLPDARHFFYTAVTGTCCPASKPGTIKIGSLDEHESAVALLQADSSAAYVANRMLFAREQTLMAVALDPDRRRLAGDAVPVTRVSTEGSRYVSASVSNDGTLVYASGGSLSTQLTWFDRAGKILGTPGEGWIDVNLSLSPDEHQVALALRSGENLDIWTIDVARNLRNRVTSDPEPEGWPVWSPNGTTIVFGSGASGLGGLPVKARLIQIPVNGSGAREVLVEAVGTPSRPCAARQCVLAPTDWSIDGRFVLYTFSGTFPATSDIWALPLSGERKPFPVIQTEFTEGQGALSPDGRWIAYTTDATGQPNVHIQPFLRAGAAQRISPNGGRNPHWRADGKELFYLDAAGTMTAVPIDLTTGSAAGLPKTLFPAGVVSTNNMYAVTKDAQRFLVNRNAAIATPLTVIVNWISTLHK
jgi:serine/threonine protein kinase/Tol biopolymer transport system component